MGSELAAILEAHALIATDETFLGAIVAHIRRDRVNAEWALAEVTRELGGRLAAADSAAMREREADIADVAREIGAQLTGGERPVPTELPRGSILVADELSPADAARLDPRRVLALLLYAWSNDLVVPGDPVRTLLDLVTQNAPNPNGRRDPAGASS